MKWGKIGILVVILVSLFGTAYAEILPYRPACSNPATITNKPWTVTNFWQDGALFSVNGISGTHGTYNICYQNENTTYFQYDWGILDGKLFRDMEDIYSTAIGGQSNSLKAREGFTVHFEYYIPTSTEGICYAQDIMNQYGNQYQPIYSKQMIFMNNVDYSAANCNGCTDFLDAQYKLAGDQLSCDVWHTFEYQSSAFDNEFGKQDRLVSFGFQFANVYVRNVWFQRGGVSYKLY